MTVTVAVQTRTTARPTQATSHRVGQSERGGTERETETESPTAKTEIETETETEAETETKTETTSTRGREIVGLVVVAVSGTELIEIWCR
jgi:hypothetical protein